ncbi:ClbS/DfsB family four-helix bundle protein [Isobaculum melis]|uniref:ClbS/DfsB family four-helix bundle protein n=1 Tax=Isobaculum melis TaxID=142588 RepID=A0A1H9RKY4_9LACT|nr:ClbS/DfsB family four-helix bundle protein [Isobaculum melis]SER73420.1 hypothetical protein SAMN04488559_104133 [Isobaculum melis]
MATSALPKTKQALKDEIHKRYLLLDGEFDAIAEADRDVRDEVIDRTPAEIIAYQIGWLRLLMKWDADEKAGKEAVMPREGFKWNRLGEMYQIFYQDCEGMSLTDMRKCFKQLEQDCQAWIDGLSDEELFTQGVRQWTGDNESWAMVRWIKINTISPFTNFRTKIRKWKKNQLVN